VLEAARREQVRRVVLASSCAVYGNQSGPLSEAATSRPVSPYAASKLAMEDLARLYHSAFGVETVCLRLFNVYGPRQSAASAYAAVIPLFIQQTVAGRAVTIHGDGHQSRDFVYVDDVVQSVRLASTAAAAGGILNIGQGKSITILQLVETLRQLLPGTTPAFGPPRPGDVQESAADIGRAAESLGYRPAWDLHKGLSATVEWTRASGSTATA
jgi:UDP-glucose 4-epimerase